MTLGARWRAAACLGWASGLTLGIASVSAATGGSADGAAWFTIRDHRITESSALLRSPGHDGIWWTSNDSGDSARIFALTSTGEVTAQIRFDAKVRDVEALTSFGKDLVVCDIGDNLRRRSSVWLYVLTEPVRLSDATVPARRVELRYPDGAHNAESVAIHPSSGRLVIVTKEDGGGQIFGTAGRFDPAGSNDLVRIGTAPPLATDAVFTADGSRLLVRTVATLTVYTWPGLTVSGGAVLPVVGPDGDFLIGESLALGPDPSTLLVGSEGKNSPVFQIRLPPSSTNAAPAAEFAAAPGSGSGSSTGPTTGQARSSTRSAASTPGSSVPPTMAGARWGLLGAVAAAAIAAGVTGWLATRRTSGRRGSGGHR